MGVALFSFMDAAMKGLALSIGLFNALFWRSFTGSVLGLVLMLATRQRWPGKAALRLHIIRGIDVAVMAAFFFWALTKLPMAEAIALSFIAPLIALYLAALLLKEQIGKQAVIASILGLAGVGVILSARMRGSYQPDALLGAGAVLISAILFAWNLILQKQQAAVASPLEVAFFQHLIMFAVFAGGAPFWLTIPDPAHAALVSAAAFMAFTSLFFLSWAYARAEAQKLIPVEYTAFIWSAIAGWLFFAEKLALSTLAGAALIVTGCIIAARGRPKITPHVESIAA